MKRMARVRERIDGIKARLLPRYQRLQPREQRLLQVAAWLVPALVLVFGLILPLHDRVVRLRSDIGALAAQAGVANALADQLRLHGTRAPAAANPMSGIETAAQQTKVRGFITRIKPDLSPADGKQRLIVNLKAAPYADLVHFLGRLRAQGMRVARAKLYAIDQPGLVDAELTLSN
jgi:type II secretory pathway component PulM